ncbi:PREDICTED: transcription initiation factor TFIID subunit 3 isoform X2 [Dufourea novaeangliae]|uniref:transcription initiation factor TFIID subunit 3 isoform X2 n=1 Tax=Dufourea novaeangliae TaxID=178035 RepID=UPI000766FAEC|nr:PREDICTED: transcription initiation factor TFIID subunit 3 isoform X2 [Dufourea novaeangliae]
MSTEYSRSVLKMVVAQICQTIGWHSINSTPLEFMVDLMQEYILRLAKLTHQYAEILGRTEANLDDMGLAFQHMNIDVQELAEYIKNVDSVPYPIAVPKFPIRRENHLNFLKPGSREVVTRPVHVHEHLPAMYPGTEEEYITEKTENLMNGSSDLTSSNGASANNSMNMSPHRMSPQVVFKRPGDPVSFESPIVKRVKVLEEGRPLREIHSVMMTTSGFLSPAREGKLPEARTPHQTRSDSPQPSSYPMVPPELKYDKKPKKIIKKGLEDGKLDKENKKKNRAKELFKPNKVDDNKIKKLAGMKELAKLKPLKPGGGKSQSTAQGSSSRPSTPKLMSPKTTGSPKLTKKSEPKAKTEKIIDLTGGSPPVERKEENIDKLPSEPDKQKLNIFKKISKPREDKDKDTSEQHKYKELDSRESSPGLIIDENTDKQALRNDIEIKHEEKKAPHTPDVHLQSDAGELIDLQSPGSDVYMFDDMSPPGTPSTPRTPELNMPTTPTDHKKKRKEKISKKKELKSRSPKHCGSPKKTKLSNDSAEVDILDRPKTPQAPEPQLSKEPSFPPTLPFPFFSAFPPAPGLIPHPMFPRFPLPLGRGGPGPHPAMPNLPLPPRFLNLPVKTEDFPNVSKNKTLDREKPPAPSPIEITPPVTKHERLEKEKEEKPKIVKQDKEIPTPVLTSTVAPPLSSALAAPVTYPTPVPIVPSLPSKGTKNEKLDKNEKKSKEHKKEKKDKLKKKKDKKEKHKEKTEKVKEKKEKVDKKEKVEKVKEKKDKKDKRKEKELQKEDKNAEAVPKITLKLGTASPRPPTPDSTPMKKITIKTLLKKPEEETKREPSPELAKISALVTRPPKQKSASKKTEEGILDGSPALPTDTFSASLTSVPLATIPRAKKSLFKALPQRETPPSHFDPVPKIPTPLPQQQPPYYFDQGGRQVWICPGCGNQDDGSPMVGCDDCDAWYHWVCVGMQVPPADNEDWYCRFCIAKKQELHHDKKKKKRKKKVKVAA